MLTEFCSKKKAKALINDTYLVDRAKTNNNNI